MPGVVKMSEDLGGHRCARIAWSS